MYILSLSFGLSIHKSVNSWPNHFKISKVVVDKGTSGCRSITSSIYLNWNIFVIYCRFEIKLVSVKAEWRRVFFVRITFKVTSGLADMTSLNFQLRISLLFYVWLVHNLVTGVRVVHGIIYKILCDIEGHFDLWGQWQCKCIFFTLSLGLSVHNSVNSWPNYFKLSNMVVDKGTSGWKGVTSSLYLNWHISVINCRIKVKLVLV